MFMTDNPEKHTRNQNIQKSKKTIFEMHDAFAVVNAAT